MKRFIAWLVNITNPQTQNKMTQILVQIAKCALTAAIEHAPEMIAHFQEWLHQEANRLQVKLLTLEKPVTQPPAPPTPPPAVQETNDQAEDATKPEPPPTAEAAATPAAPAVPDPANVVGTNVVVH